MALFRAIIASLCLVSIVAAQEDGGSSDTIGLAHGITASLSWVIFFPLGAIMIRLIDSPRATWLHAGIQGGTTLLLVASAATGIVLARENEELDSYHAIIGLVLFSLVFLQISGGILHHLLYRKHHRRTVVSHMHIWLGRTLITLGMINGGLGILLADNADLGEKIAYGVITGVVWVIYVAVATSAVLKQQKRVGRPSKV